MGEAALKVVKAANYYNAGTVEFLVDSKRNFYFLEMNTRLQVEHPVTEMVTGLDLVKLQLQVARGERLPLNQEDIHMRGSAIECRVYAEDPENNFFPSPGKITMLRTPAGPGVRDDSGVYEGWTVPIDYDPLLSKLIAWGTTRDEAIRRLQRALKEYRVGGIKTNIAFFIELLEDAEFRRGNFDTGFIPQWQKRRPNRPKLDTTERDLAILAVAIHHSGKSSESADRSSAGKPVSLWKSAGRLRALRTS
jgi:acetyl-CoA carboxylase biotin carboxylase subunit